MKDRSSAQVRAWRARHGLRSLSQLRVALRFAQELVEALIVNPLDPDEIAEALHHALAMPASERKARHVALKKKVRRTSARAYRQRFLEALECRTFARSAA